jgi:hypothetical protein
MIRRIITKLSLIIIAVIIVCCNPKRNLDVSTSTEAKLYIDKKYNEFNEQYNILCNSEHNDQLKERFSYLINEINKANEFGKACINLSYEEELQVNKYCSEKLKQNSHLYELVNHGTIACW